MVNLIISRQKCVATVKMAMSKLEDHLEDPYYVLWVEAGTSLGFLKTFLENLASCVSVSLHKTIMKNILVCRQKQNNPAYMKMCSNSIISFKRSLNQWTINCCANCQCYVDQLVKCCDPPFKFKQSNFSNSDIQLWPSDAWEKAKVYMNSGQKRTHKCPQDTDLSGIINFLDNCIVSGSWWRPGLGLSKLKIAKVRDCRNAIMHSATLKISQQQFQDYVAIMLDLLQDFLMHPNLKRQAQDTVHQINEVQKSCFVVTTDAQFRVLKDRATTLRQQNKEVRTEMEELHKHCHDLIGKRDKKSQKTMEELVIKIRKKEEDLKTLDATFASVKTLVNTNQELTKRMESHISKTATSLNKTRAKLTEVRKDQRAVTKEEETVIEETIQEYQAKQERVEHFRQQAENLKRENQKIEKELETVKMNRIISEIKAEKQQQELKDVKQELQDIKAYNESLIKQTETELDKTKLERNTLKSELENVNMNYNELILIKTTQDTLIKDLRSHVSNHQDCRMIKENIEDIIQKIQIVCDINNQLEFERATLQKQLETLKTERNSIVKTVSEKFKTFKSHFNIDKLGPGPRD